VAQHHQVPAFRQVRRAQGSGFLHGVVLYYSCGGVVLSFYVFFFFNA
jgi:hypothetical protein